ncbi:MAG TPA: anti-sigma factor antagonist [bacterium]|nr:anti-sigma factor antagonist [bacterium]
MSRPAEPQPHPVALLPRRTPVLAAIALALLVSLATSLVVLLLHESYPSQAFAFLYLPVVAVVAFLGGRGPGLLSVVISLLVGWYVLLGPGRATGLDTGRVLFGLLFAASTIGLSEAMARLRRQTQASQALAAIVESSDDAIFAKSLDAVILTWNAGAVRMYGYSAVEAIGRPAEMLVPADRPGEIPAIMARLARGERIEHYETVRAKKDGTILDVSLTMSPIRNAVGRVVGAATIARDITDRRRVERQQQFLIEAGDLFAASLSVESLLQGIAALIVPRLADWCAIDLVDDAGELQSVTVMHRDPAKVALARRLQEQTAADPRARQGRWRVINTGRAELLEEIRDELLMQAVSDPGALATLRGLGLRSSIAVPLGAGGRIIGQLSLITAESGRRYGSEDQGFAEQIAHRAALAVGNARLHEAEAAARRTAEQVARRIGRLQAFTGALSEALTPEQVGDLTLRQIADEFGALAAALCLAEDEAEKLVAVAVRGYSPELNERWWREPERILPLLDAMRSERVVWFASWEVFRTRYHEAEPPVDPMRRGARAAIPLMLHGRAIGAMYANWVEERRFSPEELEFMLSLGVQCAQAVERARLYAREHQVATTLQRALLPADVPQVPGIRVDAAYLAATRASDVGGDWYDVFRLSDGRLCVAIGDVVGHGLQAAVIMGQVRQAIRTAALEGHEPTKVLSLANHVLALNRQEGMTTAIVGIYDPLVMTFMYAAAGHPGPIVADGSRVVTLSSGGLPLGFLGAGAPATWTVQLAPGSLLVLYTDGLIEFGRDAAAGHAALVTAVQAEQPAGSSDPAHRILDRMLSGSQARDDVAIVALALEPGPVDRLDVTLPAEPSSLRLVRQAVTQLSTGVGLDQRRSFDLNVAVGEAVNNVVEHAYGAATGTVHLRAFREDSVLRIEVEDTGRWRPDRPDNPGGRGFNLMRALTDGMHVVTGENGTIVRLTIRLQPAHAVKIESAPPVAGSPAPAGSGRPERPTKPAAAPGEDAVARVAPLIEVHESGGPAPQAEALGAARIDVRTEDGTPVVTPSGDLDLSNAVRFLEALERVAADAQGLIVVVLDGVSYFDSQGVRALLRAQQRLAASRVRLAAVAPAGSMVRRLIEVAGLGTAIPLFDTVSDALARRSA